MVLKAAPGQSTAGFSGSLDLLIKVIFRAEAASKKCERSEREKERQSDERGREKRQGSLEEEWKRKNSGRGYEERKHF